jgi:hypothetical protein
MMAVIVEATTSTVATPSEVLLIDDGLQQPQKKQNGVMGARKNNKVNGEGILLIN